MSQTLTLEVTSPETYCNITVPIPAGQMMLVSYRCDILASSTVPYRHLGLEIGNIVNSHYIIDNQPGANFFRLPLSASSAVTVGSGGTSVVSTFVPNCNIPLTMTGGLDQSFYVRARYLDRSVSPPVFKLIPGTDLQYLSLTFAILN